MSKKQISWGFLLMFIIVLALATKLTPHTEAEITQKQNTNYSPLNLPIAFASTKPYIGLRVEKAEVGQLPKIKIEKDQLPKIQDIKLTLTNNEQIITTSRQADDSILNIVVGKSNSQIAEENRLLQEKAEADQQARLAYLNSLKSKPKIKLVRYNRFPYGWCTYYVASRRNIPWSGNAKAWDDNARAMGYTVSRIPKVGSILVQNYLSVWGHVAYVESVSGGTVTVSEMNYAGWGIVSRRTISSNSGVYIY